MRIISLNVWLGKLKDPLIAFLEREAKTTDIFCLQEMTSSLGSDGDLFSAVKKSLPGFQGFFEPAQDEGGGVEAGLAIFIKKNDKVDKEGDFFVYRTRNSMIGKEERTIGRNAQFVEFPTSGKEYAVVNFHGLWSGNESLNNDARIDQSRKLKDLLNTLGGRKILCGDFNLTKDEQSLASLAILEKGMRNLINEYGVTATRPERYFPHPDRLCDYMLVDKDVEVVDFKVLQDEVSDHLPLLLEFK